MGIEHYNTLVKIVCGGPGPVAGFPRAFVRPKPQRKTEVTIQNPNQLHYSNGALLTTARRAKRENGGLGEDPPGSSIDPQPGPKDLLVRSLLPAGRVS